MFNIIIGTGGHIDHGKSSILQSLTGFDADRTVLEKKRGITVNLGFAHMDTDHFTIFFLDVPGHCGFVRNMITGVCGYDMALFAVDAKEGIRQQTREHAFIIRSAKIDTVIVAITKSDLADRVDIDKCKVEAYDYFAECGFEDITLIETSIYDAASIEGLRSLIIEKAASIKRNMNGENFRMNIDRVFTVKGAGTVVTGSVLSGCINAGDYLAIHPGGKRVRLKRIQCAGADKPYAQAHDRAALNLADIAVNDIKTGDVLYIGDIDIARRFQIKITNQAECGAVLNDNKLYNAFIGTDKRRCRINTRSSSATFDKPVPAKPGDIFFIRAGSPETTVASCEIIEAAKRKKNQPIEQKHIPHEPKSEMPECAQISALLKEQSKPVSKGDIMDSLNISATTLEKSLKKLLNDGIIASADNFYMITKDFDRYIAIAKNNIAGGKVDIKLFKELSGLSRNQSAALLDKGARLGYWSKG